MTNEEQTLLLLRGAIASLEEGQQAEVKRCAAELREWLKRQPEGMGILALSLVGAELSVGGGMTKPVPKDFQEHLQQCKAAYASLSPVDRALFDSDAARLYAYGETGRYTADVLADEVRRLRREVVALKHDVDSYVRCAGDLATELADARAWVGAECGRKPDDVLADEVRRLRTELAGRRAVTTTVAEFLHSRGITDKSALRPGFIYGDLATLAQDLEDQLADARSKCIAGFYEDEVPTFTQGAPTHEIQEYVDAEEVTGYVAEIQRLRAQLKRAAQLASIADDCNIYDIQLEGEEWTDTMSLYHEFLAAAEGKA